MRSSAVLGLIILASLMSAPATAADPSFDLGDGNTLQVAAAKDTGTLTVSILSGQSLVESVTIGNAGVDAGKIKVGKFCGKCEPAYFVPAYDLSSTYGATTGIVVWKRKWWSISILPFDLADSEGPDSNGVLRLVDIKIVSGRAIRTRYTFVDGFLRRE
jgi:hypothetical protein